MMSDGKKCPYTVDELNEMAKSLGYHLIKNKQHVKVLPCVCGNKKWETWFSASDKPYKYIYKCPNCGLSVTGNSYKEIKEKRNQKILEQQKYWKGKHDNK